MATNPDFRDLFAALNAAGVRFLLVGGYAVAHHAEPRYTKDLDLWVEPSPENAGRVLTALREFRAPIGDLTAADLCNPDIVFHMGIPPNRIDLLSGIDGVEFAPAWASRVESTYAGEAVPVIGREDLIRNKRAAGRPQDLLDAELLERMRPA
jgi:hypothetical protein